MKLTRLFAIFLLAVTANQAPAQDAPAYSPRHSFSAFAEYSDTSSHIILGVSRNRRLVAFGLAYSLRLFHTRYADWYYNPELHPFTLLRDPVATQTFNASNSGFSQTFPIDSTCMPGSYTVFQNGSAAYSYKETCSTRWIYAGGLSPLGQRINFVPRHRLQPFVMGNGGFLVAPRDIPINDSSRFNFTFEFGAGLQLFRDRHHSWSAEYRIHHISNGYTGDTNPGVDSQIVKITYNLNR